MDVRVWHGQVSFWGPHFWSCTVSPGSPWPGGGQQGSPRHQAPPWGWRPALLQPDWGRVWQHQELMWWSWDLGRVGVLGEGQGQGTLVVPSELQLHWMPCKYLTLFTFMLSLFSGETLFKRHGKNSKPSDSFGIWKNRARQCIFGRKHRFLLEENSCCMRLASQLQEIIWKVLKVPLIFLSSAIL